MLGRIGVLLALAASALLGCRPASQAPRVPPLNPSPAAPLARALISGEPVVAWSSAARAFIVPRISRDRDGSHGELGITTEHGKPLESIFAWEEPRFRMDARLRALEARLERGQYERLVRHEWPPDVELRFGSMFSLKWLGHTIQFIDRHGAVAGSFPVEEAVGYRVRPTAVFPIETASRLVVSIHYDPGDMYFRGANARTSFVVAPLPADMRAALAGTRWPVPAPLGRCAETCRTVVACELMDFPDCLATCELYTVPWLFECAASSRGCQAVQSCSKR
jgi:hypothetical protein